MSAKRVNLKGWACKCERCGHEWVSLDDNLPLRCAGIRCKTPYWNKPRQRAVVSKRAPKA